MRLDIQFHLCILTRKARPSQIESTFLNKYFYFYFLPLDARNSKPTFHLFEFEFASFDAILCTFCNIYRTVELYGTAVEGYFNILGHSIVTPI